MIKFKVSFLSANNVPRVLFVEYSDAHAPGVYLQDIMTFGVINESGGRWIGIPPHRILKIEEIRDITDIHP